MFDGWSGSLKKWHEQYYDEDAIKKRKIKKIKSQIKYLEDQINDQPRRQRNRKNQLAELQESLNLLLEN